MKHFLLIDPDKNVLLVPTTCPILPELINSVGRDNVISHETQGQLLVTVKDYLKAAKNE